MTLLTVHTARLQLCPLSPCLDHLMDNQNIKDGDGCKGQEGVDDGIYPWPDVYNQLLGVAGPCTLGDHFTSVTIAHHSGCPEEVEIDGQQQAQ